MDLTRRPRPVRAAPWLAAFVSLACGSALAGTVEIGVYERGGAPVANQAVALYAATVDPSANPFPFPPSRPAGRCATGVSGRCQIAGLSPGVYVPYLGAIADPNLCTPPGSPRDAYGTVTLAKPDSVAPLRIELARGVRINFRVVSAKAPLPPKTRVELLGEDGDRVVVNIGLGGSGQITLASGRWVAHLAGPPGALVTNVELDGAEVDVLDVPVELRAPSSDRFVSWTLSPPCKVWGTLRSSRERPGVDVEATVVSPGPWAGSTRCRTVSCAEPITVPVTPQGYFAMELPSGMWRLAPVGESLLESTPPSIDVACEEGGEAHPDFSVRETEPGGGPRTVLNVFVQDPDGRPLPRVPVEAWPPSGNLNAEAPLAIEPTGPYFLPAAFKKLAAGSYLLRVRAPGYRSAVTAVFDLDPDATPTRSVTMRLTRGATIDALVTDRQDRPVTGVSLRLTWIDSASAGDDPAARLAAPEPNVSVEGSKDQTGHVVATGLAGGTYEVEPILSGASALGGFVSIGAGKEAGKKSIVVSVGEHDVKEVFVRVTPAASLAGRLVCVNGSALPQRVETCVLGLPAADEDDAARMDCRNPAIPSATVALTGEPRDAFRVGPLSPGSYRLGLRPRGFTEWTWALGTPDGAQAAALQVNGSDAVELGNIAVLCGPAVEVLPTVLSHDPPPDLTLAVATGKLTRPASDGTIDLRVATATRERDRVVFRELPEGAWTLDVTITHPHFMPADPVRVSFPINLERGVKTTTNVEVAAIGGAIAIPERTGAARVSHPGGEPRIVPAQGGGIAVDGVPPGTYAVELCGDPACTRIVRRWDAVSVARGRTVVLDPQIEDGARSLANTSSRRGGSQGL